MLNGKPDTRTAVFFSDIIRLSLVTFYDSIKEFFKDSEYICFGRMHQETGLFLAKLINSFWKKIAFLLLFDIFPKIIVLSAFLLDIFLFHKFFFFYKFSFLLIMPLIISFLLYTFDGFCTRNIRNFDTALCFLDKEGKRINSEELYYYYAKEEEFDIQNYRTGLCEIIMLEHVGVKYSPEKSVSFLMKTLYYCLFPIALFFHHIDVYRNFYSKYLMLMIYLGYMIGWGYVVYFGI